MEKKKDQKENCSTKESVSPIVEEVRTELKNNTVNSDLSENSNDAKPTQDDTGGMNNSGLRSDKN